MQELNRQMMALPELRELEEIIRFGTGPAAVSGVSGVHRAMLGAALRQETKRPLAVLCADEQEARRMAADLAALTGEECVTLFAREWQLRDRVSASHSFEQERLDALCRMAFGRTGIVVATVDGMLQRTLPPTALRDAVLTLRLGEEHDLRALAERLTAAGYVRCEQVEGAGQFAVRGGILDVYSPMSAPVRVEFFDTEIDAMGEFDVATQRRTKNLEELTVLPAAEVLPFAAEGGRDAMLARMEHAAAQLAKKVTTEKTAAAIRADMDRLREGLPLGGMDRYLAAAYPTAVCAADYLPEGSIVLVCEGSRVMERAKGCAFEWGEDLKILLEEGVLAGQFASLAVELEGLTRRLRGSFPLLLCDSLPTSRYLALPRAMLSINARQLPSYGGSLETAAADMEHYLAAGSGVLVLCGNETRARNFHRLLEERGVRARLDLSDQTLPAAGETVIGLGALSAGCEYPQLRLVILTEGQLLAPVSGKAPRAVRQKKDSSRQKLRSYTDLTPGDLVVHQRHGIGRFVGMERIRVDGADKDYIKIAYAGSDSLYVPATQLDMVSKYIGSHGGGEEGEHVKLNKLGGTDWTKAKSRAKAAAKDLAKGLIKLYAERQRRPGFAFSPDSTWQREFEDAFDYEETDDQLRAIAEIKSDMERSRPMDRPALRRRGLRKNGGRAARGDEMRARRQAGGDPGADHRAGAAALRHRHQPLPQLSGDDRGALALQDAGAEKKDFAKRGGGEDRPAHRHARAAAKGAALQGPRIARHRRGAALRRDAQGKAQGAFQAGGHAHALRDAHSAHTEHGAVGHPRYVHHRDAAAATVSRCRPMYSSTIGA